MSAPQVSWAQAKASYQRQGRRTILCTVTPLSKALAYYRRCCRIRDHARNHEAMVSSQRNRLKALPILREALDDEVNLLTCLRLVHDQGEIDRGVLAAALNIRMNNASTQLKNFWKEMVEVRGLMPEHIFLERRKVNLPKGGSEFRYRLSALGKALMEEDS